MIFQVGTQRLGVRAGDVVEVVRAATLSPPHPGGHRVVKGLLNFRGVTVPVLDMRRFLGLPTRDLKHTDHLIVVLVQQRLLALMVDRALDLDRFEIEDAQIGSVVPGAEHAEVIARCGDALVPLIDLSRLVSLDDGEHVTAAGVEPTEEPPN